VDREDGWFVEVESVRPCGSNSSSCDRTQDKVLQETVDGIQNRRLELASSLGSVLRPVVRLQLQVAAAISTVVDLRG
jgi:hypothetical protein